MGVVSDASTATATATAAAVAAVAIEAANRALLREVVGEWLVQLLPEQVVRADEARFDQILTVACKVRDVVSVVVVVGCWCGHCCCCCLLLLLLLPPLLLLLLPPPLLLRRLCSWPPFASFRTLFVFRRLRF